MPLFPATNLLGEIFRAAPTLLSKEVPSGRLGQLDFLGGQVLLKLTGPMGKGQANHPQPNH